jgi:hypothetical protein
MLSSSYSEGFSSTGRVSSHPIFIPKQRVVFEELPEAFVPSHLFRDATGYKARYRIPV